MAGEVTAAEMQAAMERRSGALTEREKRVKPAEHVLVDAVTGERLKSALTAATVEQIRSGQLVIPSGESVRMQLRDGSVRKVGGDMATELLNSGGRILGVTEETRAEHEETLQRSYGDRPGMALAQGLAGGASFGLSDVAAGALGYGEQVRETREREPVYGVGAEAVGAVVPMLFSGGTSAGVSAGAKGAGAAAKIAGKLPTGLLARGAQAAERGIARGAGEGLGGRVLAKGVGGAVEGGGLGFATGLSELGLSDDPVTMERAASVLKSHTLYGAGVGAGAGAGMSLLGSAAKAGLKKGRKIVEDAGAKMRGGASVGDDVAKLDRAGLRTAKDAEYETLKIAQVADKEKIAAEIADYHRLVDEGGAFAGIENAGLTKELTGTQRRLRSVLGNEKGFAANPGKALDSLQRQEATLQKAIGQADEAAEKVAASYSKLARTLEDDLATLPKGGRVQLTAKQARMWASVSEEKIGAKTIAEAVKTKGAFEIGEESARKALDALQSGSALTRRTDAIGKLSVPLEANKALQARMTEVYAPLASSRLEAIAAAGDALTTGGKGLGAALSDYGSRAALGTMAGGPVGGLALAVAPKVLDKLKGLIGTRLARAGAEASARTTSAVDAILAKGKTVSRVVRPTTTKTLEGLAYGGAVIPPSVAVPSGQRALAAFHQRRSELMAMTEPGPDGALQVKPTERQKIADRIKGLAMLSSAMADQMETIAARRVEYLAAKLPRQPDMMASQMGPSRWRPSDMEIASFARSAAAVEDPISVLERVADASVTPEDADALRQVYPELFSEQRAEIVGRIDELRETLPYDRRLALSIFFDAPVDPSMDPGVIRILQQNFATDPGTQGGQAAPTPSPQYGAVDKSAEEPTQAQQRASQKGSQ